MHLSKLYFVEIVEDYSKLGEKMNYLKLSILTSFIFLVGCSSDTEEAEETAVVFSEFMTCTPGVDFNPESARMMIDEWNDIEFPEGFFSWGHQPLDDSTLGGEGKVYWQLFWESEEDADAAWAQGPSEEFAAWQSKYESVLTCDGENRRGYDSHWPRDVDASGEWDDDTAQWVTYGHYCKSNDDADFAKLDVGVEAFNAYLDESETGEDGPFTFGIYFHSGENPEPYDQYDFFWMNYYESHEDAEAGYARFQANGSDVQELFNAAASCEGPFGMDTYQFYPDPDDA